VQVAKHVEAAFESWAKLVWRRPYVIIALMVSFALGLASQIPMLEIDTSTENFLRDDDPVRVTYDRFREQFGRDLLLILAIEPPDVFDFDFLRKLEQVHRDLENEVPYLEKVTSLVNARFTRGEDDVLIVGDLLEDFPQSESDLEVLRERALANPFFRNTVLSADGRIAVILIETQAYSSEGVEVGDADALDGFDEENGAARGELEFLSGAENEEFVDAVKGVLARYEGPGFPVRMAGGILLSVELQRAM